MCGICGLVTVDGAPEPALVDRMREAIVHRGPDDGSTDCFGRCVLGHQRLIVVDPEAGYQPVTNESGDVVAVFNGELYNFPELRASLRGHDVRGRGDTPVIPHLYEEHGVDFVRRLEGMFALALWDAARGRLLLARDRVGKKPLLWTRLPDETFAFASELKALLALPSLAREIDMETLDAYLALGYVPGSATGIAGVRKLPPGHVLVLENGVERIEPYWRLAPREEARDDGEWLELVRDEVRAAVRRRLVADVPLGALLSGGIDSSVVVALMAEESREPVRTFTVGFADAAYDERRWARVVAERYGTRHEEVVLETDVAATLERLVATLDEPLADEAILPLYLICEAARRSVTVALTGDGGDESFGGYERYAALQLAARVPRAVAGARRLLSRGERRSRAARAARFLDLVGTPPHERYGRVMEVFGADERRALLGGGRSAHAYLGDPPYAGVRGLQALDAATYLANDLLPKADLASMANSLELRSPFLDHRVLELGLSLPDRLKVRGRRGKLALRRAFGELLPREVAERGKAGFGLPLADWFRGELREIAYDVIPSTPLVARGEVERLLAEHERGADQGHRLWALLVLELWRRSWVDSPVVAAA
jgi:asparagine synthase (glutamine-hydrolysing)